MMTVFTASPSWGSDRIGFRNAMLMSILSSHRKVFSLSDLLHYPVLAAYIVTGTWTVRIRFGSRIHRLAYLYQYTKMKQVMAIVLLQTLSLAVGCRAEQLEQPRVAIATASDAKSGSNMISINLPPSECQNLSPMFSGKVKSFKPDWGTYCEAFK